MATADEPDDGFSDDDITWDDTILIGDDDNADVQMQSDDSADENIDISRNPPSKFVCLFRQACNPACKFAENQRIDSRKIRLWDSISSIELYPDSVPIEFDSR